MQISRKYIIIFGIAVFLLILLKLYLPEEISWEANLSAEEKTPYGTWVMHRSMSDLFGQDNVKATDQSFYDFYLNTPLDTFNVVKIRPGINPSRESLEYMLAHVEEGNTIFLSAFSFGHLLMDTLGIEAIYNYSGKKKDQKLKLRLKEYPEAESEIRVQFTSETYFLLSVDTGQIDILGTTGNNLPNYLRVTHGKGSIFLHSSPLAFSNYHILRDDTRAYAEQVLTALPAEEVVWMDESMLISNATANPLRYVLSVKTLRIAWYLLIFTALLYLLFNIKRRQRAIPVAGKPPENALLYVKSVTRLYLHDGHHKAVAMKKIRHFKAFLKDRFYLRTMDFSENDAILISKKSKYDLKKLKALFAGINSVQQSGKITAGRLIAMDKDIESFKTETEKPLI